MAYRLAYALYRDAGVEQLPDGADDDQVDERIASMSARAMVTGNNQLRAAPIVQLSLAQFTDCGSLPGCERHTVQTVSPRRLALGYL